VAGEVGEREHPDRASGLVGDGEPADLVLLHETLGHLDRVALAHGDERGRAHARHARLRRGPVARERGHADVAVGDHPDGAAPIIDDRDRTAVTLPHDPRRVGQRALSTTGENASGHHACDVHWAIPSATPTTATSSVGATEAMPSEAPSSSAATAPGATTTATGLPSEAPIPGSALTAAPTSEAPPPSWTDGQILDVIHDADEGEIEQAELASSRAHDGRVRQFAAMMVKDHTAADSKTHTVAGRLATTFEPSAEGRRLDASARSETETLRIQTGADFDRAYIAAQIEEHQAVLAAIDDDLMPHAQSRELKDLLTEIRGKVMVHLQRAQALDAAMLR
jgi:putative membrane protein